MAGDETHPYGGLESGALYGRYGAMGVGLYGSGAGHQSVVVGGGPAMELVDLGFASLTGYVGPGWYREHDERSGADRSLVGALVGLSTRVPFRVGAVRASVTAWRGTADGGDVVNPISATGLRFSLGFGL